jgi:hypothetical protein
MFRPGEFTRTRARMMDETVMDLIGAEESMLIDLIFDDSLRLDTDEETNKLLVLRVKRGAMTILQEIIRKDRARDELDRGAVTDKLRQILKNTKDTYIKEVIGQIFLEHISISPNLSTVMQVLDAKIANMIEDEVPEEARKSKKEHALEQSVDELFPSSIEDLVRREGLRIKDLVNNINADARTAGKKGVLVEKGIIAFTIDYIETMNESDVYTVVNAILACRENSDDWKNKLKERILIKGLFGNNNDKTIDRYKELIADTKLDEQLRGVLLYNLMRRGGKALADLISPDTKPAEIH